MLRWLVVVLLLANALWFGWTRGWFAPAWLPPRHAESEPERLAAQVRPDAVVVLPPKAASAAVTAARAADTLCLEAGPLADSEDAAAQAALAAAQLPDGSVARDPAGPGPHRLRVAQADSEMQQRLLDLPPAALAGGFKPCGRP